jgi:hypothetical protein
MTSAGGKPMSAASDAQSLAGVWQGIVTGREMNSGSGAAADSITLVVAGDGTWTTTKGTERWTGTLRPIAGGFELEGTSGSARRPVSMMLHRYGEKGLGGAAVTDYQGRRASLTVDLRAVPNAADQAGGGDTPSPSASPATIGGPLPGGLLERYPELRPQAP